MSDTIDLTRARTAPELASRPVRSSESARATESAAAKPRVLLVDDHALLVEGLALALRREGLEVTTVTELERAEVLERVVEVAPQVVLLDLMLGEDSESGAASGRDLIGPISESSGAEVLMLTGVTDRVALAECLEAGAAGLLRKSAHVDEIVAAVTRLAAGEPAMREHERLGYLVELRLHREQRREELAPFDALTTREQEILAGLIEGKSPQEIAEESYVGVGTVRSQIKSLRIKLGAPSQLAAVGAAHKVGWRLRERPAGVPLAMRSNRG